MSAGDEETSLQERVNGLNSDTTLSELNSILLELAGLQEACAAVYVYDYLAKIRGFTPNDKTKLAMQILHDKKLVPKETIKVPENGRWRANAKRIVHKICRVWNEKPDSKRAQSKWDEVLKWVKENRPLVEKIKAKKRNVLARLIAKHTSANELDARILVNTMKHRKRLSTLNGKFCVL